MTATPPRDVRITLKQLAKRAIDRPPGYSEEVISRGTIEDGRIVIAWEVYRELRLKYRGEELLPGCGIC